MIIHARLEQTRPASRRTSLRRKISLESNLHATGDAVAIHDFSATGMLIETAANLPRLGRIEIDLPEASNTHAIVVWNSGRYYGCEFKEPLPKAVISAVLLRSQPTLPKQPSQPRPFVVMRADVGAEAFQSDATSAPQTDKSLSPWYDEKAPLTVRLRVILGSAILLWTIIIWAVWSVIKFIR